LVGQFNPDGGAGLPPGGNLVQAGNPDRWVKAAGLGQDSGERFQTNKGAFRVQTRVNSSPNW